MTIEFDLPVPVDFLGQLGALADRYKVTGMVILQPKEQTKSEEGSSDGRATDAR